MIFRIIISFFLILTFSNCSKEDKIYTPSKRIDPYIIYNEGLEAFKKNDFFFASKKFSEAELNFKSIEFAAKSSIMTSFSLYRINFYNEAIENLENFINKYPSDKNIIYAHFLTAIIYFEQIEDEKKDLKPLREANNKINFFLKNYPDSDYALDLKFKKNLILNQLAAKEMYIAKYYISVQKWVPAISRLKVILDKYDQTVYVEEALHRLVEINYHLGLEEEAKNYAKILGYNYNSSEWYKQSYKVLNKEFKIEEIVKKNNNKKLKEKSLFNRIIKIIN